MWKDTALRKTFVRPLLSVAVVLLLQACGSNPADTAPSNPDEVPELTLNLPGAEATCNCDEPERPSATFLERGFTAVAGAEYIEAVQHFQRYRRLEKSSEANYEAGIAVAYISILPESPFYNTEEARKSYRDLREKSTDGMELHEQTLLMRQSLETFLLMERQINEVKETNAAIKKKLAKREEALKRLRELTLGQSEE